MVISNVKHFIMENNINQSNFYMMVNGVIPHIKGYSLKPRESNVRGSYYPVTFRHTDGTTVTITDSKPKKILLKNILNLRTKSIK